MLEQIPGDGENGTLTFGGRAVGLDFNPSNDSIVDNLKEHYADIIDRLDNVRSMTVDAEVKRLTSIAITEAQTAQMWAVKSVTWEKI